MVRRVLEWWSGRPQVADALLAVVACAYLLIEVPYSDRSITDPGSLPVMFWGDLVVYASLVWRRRFPVAVLALVWTLWFIGGRWDIWAEWNASWAELSTPTALMFMLYTGGRWTSSAWTRLFVVGTLLPAVLTAVQVWAGLVLVPFPMPSPPDDLFATSFAVCVAAWGLGRLRRSEAEAIARAVTSAEESRAQAILAEERMRIAREVHDIVAHNVSAMVIQSDGAAAALLDEDIAEASTAIEAIGRSGRTALTELRLLLGILREAPLAPQPGIDAIQDLAERLPNRVRLRVEGQVRQTPPGLGLAAYRIVQEALTNTLKHAGKEADAEVLLRYADDGLHIQVTNDGAGRGQYDPPGRGLDGSGFGLIGMRERAAMFGGTAHATALPAGGFRVAATLRWT
ncbi:sensor histidine kinase [Nonomuraea basaltis]|uniref:sensor histidine kinase n=1 Tax=Nonomuraea basaltis TaxID=2495887 RepID=UPI00110C5DBE|nr:sensor histidine kinase [Nonomuraea basaltis]TMR93298.1 sensor histidine kinase [Nonomuraea basaltis]